MRMRTIMIFCSDPKTNKWNVPAPRKINDQIFKQDVQRAIRTGNKYFGD